MLLRDNIFGSIEEDAQRRVSLSTACITAWQILPSVITLRHEGSEGRRYPSDW